MLLWLQIGPYSLICLGVLFLSIPLDIILSAKVSSTRVSAQKATDNRLKLVHELLSSIRIVKVRCAVCFDNLLHMYTQLPPSRMPGRNPLKTVLMLHEMMK